MYMLYVTIKLHQSIEYSGSSKVMLSSTMCDLLYPPCPKALFNTLLHDAAMGGDTTILERLLSTPGIDVNVKNGVSWCV